MTYVLAGDLSVTIVSQGKCLSIREFACSELVEPEGGEDLVKNFGRNNKAFLALPLIKDNTNKF